MCEYPEHPLVTKPLIVAWLQTKDPKGEFDYFDPHNCCLAQYIKPFARGDVSCNGYNFIVGPFRYSISSWLIRPLISRTFGQVLTKLEAVE